MKKIFIFVLMLTTLSFFSYVINASSINVFNDKLIFDSNLKEKNDNLENKTFKGTRISIVLDNDLDTMSIRKAINALNLSPQNSLCAYRSKVGEYYKNLRLEVLNKYPFLSSYDINENISSSFLFLYTNKKINSLKDLKKVNNQLEDLILDEYIEKVFITSFYKSEILGPPEIVIDPGGGGTNPPDLDLFNNIIDVINAGDAILEGKDGTGIKVGFIEPNRLIQNVNSVHFASRAIYTYNPMGIEPITDYHADNVASIAVGNYGIARDTIIYSALYTNTHYDDVNIIPDKEIQWMLNQGVNIINCSYVEELSISNTYDSIMYF